MRRISLVWLLVLAVLLSGCTWLKSLSGDSASQSKNGLTAQAVLEGTGIRFNLKGYQGYAVPTLQVTSLDGKNWSDKVEAPALQGDTYTAKLPGERGTARLAVENFDYTWTLPDGRTATGEVQFRDIRYRDMAWDVTKSAKLLVYHVKSLKDQDVKNWESALSEALDWMAVKRDAPLVIWVFPSGSVLNEWTRQDPAQRIAGQWMGGDIQRLLVYDQYNSSERQVVMLHEMVHALSPGGGPPWFEEGMARLFEGRAERKINGNNALRWAATREDLSLLHTLAQQRDVATTEALGYSNPPTDPYTLGVSVWLFVKRHHGDAGVRRFIEEGGKEGGVKPTLEALFNKPLPEIWDDWNRYLRSDDLLTDWNNP